jgi:hypothetical protein
MGADIYKEFAIAREVIDECEETLGARLRHLMFDGPQVLFPSPECADTHCERSTSDIVSFDCPASSFGGTLH